MNIKRTLGSTAVALALSVSGFAYAGSGFLDSVFLSGDDGTAGNAYQMGVLTIAPKTLFVQLPSAPWGGPSSFFEEFAEFSAPALSGGSAAANTYILTFNNVDTNRIDNLFVELWQGAPHPFGFGPVATFSGNNTTVSFALVSGGNYHFDISGQFGPNATGGQYSLSVGLIPEPETYAMLLAGLGLMGFVARRRQRKLAVA